jgi:hypothetical protein
MDMHAQAAEEFARLLRQTENGRRTLSECRNFLEDADNHDFVSAVGQPYDGWTDGQLSVLGQIAALYQESGLKLIRIRVGDPPSKSPAINRGRLATLSGCFTTALYDWPIPGEGEGMLGWRPEVIPDLPCGWVKRVRLSIGYADASMTLLHMVERGAVARWPRGCEDVWLLGFQSFTSWLDWKLDL